MRKTFFAAVLVPFLLSGCGTTGPLTQDQINAIVAQVQAYTAAACAFQPTAASVIALVSAFFPESAPFTDVVNTVGTAICKAPVTQSAVKGKAVVATRIVQTPRGPVAVKGANYR